MPQIGNIVLGGTGGQPKATKFFIESMIFFFRLQSCDAADVVDAVDAIKDGIDSTYKKLEALYDDHINELKEKF